MTSPSSRSALNPVSLILLKILVMGMLGIPFAYFFDPTNYVFRFAGKLSSESSVLKAYLAALYGFFVMAVLYYGLGLKKKMARYRAKEMVHLKASSYHWLWSVTFFLAAACFVFVFIQARGRHPALAALRADAFEIKAIRYQVGTSIQMTVFNFGLKFLIPLNMITALFFMKKRLFFFASILLFLLMGTFVLEKSPIVSLIVILIFFKMLMSGFSTKQFVFYGTVAFFLLSLMYFITKFATDVPSLFASMTPRIFYGQISDLPAYFDLFSQRRIGAQALLPPYLTGVLGLKTASASSLVMAYTNPEAVSQEIAGVANSFFVGEAYAIGGILGVAASPFVVMANLGFFIYFFSRLKKNIFFLFLFSWFLFKTFDGVFGGISYFTFSGFHLVLLLLFYFFLSLTFVKQAKRLKTAGLDV